MLLKKYNLNNRSKILICFIPEQFEDLNVDNDTFMKILNSRYSDEIFDMPPYHYIVFKDEIRNIKSTDLSHNMFDASRVYNDDIKILITKEHYYTSDKEEVAELVAKLSCKYGILLKDNFSFMDQPSNENLNKVHTEVLKKAIIKRNEIDHRYNTIEAVIDGQFVTNNKLTVLINGGQYKTLHDVSNSILVPYEFIQKINTHLEDTLRMGDLIFIPLTKPIKCRLTQKRNLKDSIYMYENVKSLIEE